MKLTNFLVGTYFAVQLYDRFFASKKVLPNTSKTVINTDQEVLQAIGEKYGQAGINQLKEIQEKLSAYLDKPLSLKGTLEYLTKSPEFVKEVCTHG